MLDIQVIPCSRCGAPCKLAAQATEGAQLLRAATRPETRGYCADCAVTEFLQNSPFGQLITEKEMLLAPHVQAQFARVMQAGNADARPEEINWQRVVELWEMPVAKGRARRSRHG